MDELKQATLNQQQEGADIVSTEEEQNKIEAETNPPDNKKKWKILIKIQFSVFKIWNQLLAHFSHEAEHQHYTAAWVAVSVASKYDTQYTPSYSGFQLICLAISQFITDY